jgi:hypothetical protein
LNGDEHVNAYLRDGREVDQILLNEDAACE